MLKHFQIQSCQSDSLSQYISSQDWTRGSFVFSRVQHESWKHAWDMTVSCLRYCIIPAIAAPGSNPGSLSRESLLCFITKHGQEPALCHTANQQPCLLCHYSDSNMWSYEPLFNPVYFVTNLLKQKSNHLTKNWECSQSVMIKLCIIYLFIFYFKQVK